MTAPTAINDEAPQPGPRSIRVLVLDDEEPIRNLLHAALARQGCTVETASDGRDGLRILLQRDFDVAVVDLRMRDMGGSAFLQVARSVWPWLGIVIVTGHADAESIAHARRHGVTRIVSKPLDLQHLFANVRTEALEKKRLVELSASHSLDRIQDQLALLRQFSETAIAAENLDDAMRTLSAGLGNLLPCSLVGVLSVQEDEQALYLNPVRPVAQAFAQAVQEKLLERYEALSGRPRPGERLRLRFDPGACAEDGPAEVGSMFTVPIVSQGDVRGLLALAVAAHDAYSAGDAAFLYHAAAQLSTILASLSRMRAISVRDALTGLYNRKGLEEEFQRAWSASRRYGWSIGGAVIDVDHFKALNDTHGHLAGDEFLREFAALIQRVARESDIVGRYGGDEVVVILPQAGPADCVAFAERLLAALRRHVFCARSLGGLKVTASIGVATGLHVPREAAGLELLRHADEALYRAKQQGRARACLYGDHAAARAPAASSREPAADGAARSPRVLVVDDDPDVAQLIARILDRAGYAAVTAGSVAEALQTIEGKPGRFEAVLTDLELPGKNGLELLAALRVIDEFLIRIVVTGRASLDNAVTSLRHGAYDFIQKPVQPAQLRAVLARAIEYRRLRLENLRYQNHLEDLVRDKSAALREALDQLKASSDFTLEAMAALMDARERSTANHSTRARDHAVILACEMGLSEQEVEDVAKAALLHDIGKMSIPDSVLLKPGPLTPGEWEIMKFHPETGYQLLRSSAHLDRVATIVRTHHEHYDGSGYPRGLKGAEIPLCARIFTVIDAYDAMRSDRVYRKAMPAEAALAEIVKHAGTHFDPAVVDAFLRCHRNLESAVSNAAG